MKSEASFEFLTNTYTISSYREEIAGCLGLGMKVGGSGTTRETSVMLESLS